MGYNAHLLHPSSHSRVLSVFLHHLRVNPLDSGSTLRTKDERDDLALASLHGINNLVMSDKAFAISEFAADVLRSWKHIFAWVQYFWNERSELVFPDELDLPECLATSLYCFYLLERTDKHITARDDFLSMAVSLWLHDEFWPKNPRSHLPIIRTNSALYACIRARSDTASVYGALLDGARDLKTVTRVALAHIRHSCQISHQDLALSLSILHIVKHESGSHEADGLARYLAKYRGVSICSTSVLICSQRPASKMLDPTFRLLVDLIYSTCDVHAVTQALHRGVLQAVVNIVFGATSIPDALLGPMKDLLSAIRSDLAIRSVVLAAEKAIQSLHIDDKTQRIIDESAIGGSWRDFERLLTERLAFLEIHDREVLKKGSLERCNNVRHRPFT